MSDLQSNFFVNVIYWSLSDAFYFWINVFKQIYVHVYARNMIENTDSRSWFLQGHAWYTRLRRRWFGGCVLFKFWGESYVKPLSLHLMYKLYLTIDWNILFDTDYCGEFWRSTAYTSCRGGVRKACYQRKQVGHNICV